MTAGPLSGLFLAALVGTLRPAPTMAQAPTPVTIPENASEARLIEQILRIRDSAETDWHRRPQHMLDLVNALLERYPESTFRDEALILKLTALSGLARRESRHLQELLSLTEQIGKADPQGRLASENAFCAIQAFVLGARLEGMPEHRRLLGTRERYEAFLEDYPDSTHVPTIAASLVRNLLTLREVDQAGKWVRRLRESYPDDPATLRAEGELFRVEAVGKPFRFEYTTADGKTLRTTDYTGKVLVIHFWTSWSGRAMKAVPELLKLHKEFNDQGLQLIGVNVDNNRRRADQALETHKMPWPQFLDEKGYGSELLIKNGVVRIPTYFVIDREGILRSTDAGGNLRDLIRELLAQPQ